MGYIAHLSNNSHIKFSFIESYAKYLDNVVEKILHKKMFKLCLEK